MDVVLVLFGSVSLLLSQILSTPSNRTRIVGFGSGTAFLDKVVNAFFSSLIQFFARTTTHVNDMIHLGRSSWPIFVLPLSPENIQKTTQAVRKEDLPSETDQGDDIVTRLQQQYLSCIGKDGLAGLITQTGCASVHPVLSNNGAVPSESTDERQPYLRSCLLLALFICQHNHPDQDRSIFSTSGNGKRKRNSHRLDDNEDEAVSYTHLTLPTKA